ncbi:MAG: peptidyl-prolyl cis-trans isomerase [Gammaproteobacteria bacterium]|nr:peptidyl-prolyl cis-trans isomerase [Gammaproteobacteria bacterium]MCF6261669.1 peptidyl-prolyl cis-trans isomerase [Gammaproteobacteria bacterium]
MMNALIRLTLLCALFVLPFTQVNADEQHPRVRITTTLGDIVLELDREKAPKSVENFLNYVREGFYDGTIFHRVIDGFMIQGGGFTQDLQKKSTRAPIKNEADNGLKNLEGTVAMARTNDPDSATAQFFINVSDKNSFLNHTSPTSRGWGYAVFGKVVEGMDVVDKIRKTPTGSGGQFRSDVPRTPVVMEKVVLDGATSTIPATPITR